MPGKQKRRSSPACRTPRHLFMFPFDAKIFNGGDSGGGGGGKFEKHGTMIEKTHLNK